MTIVIPVIGGVPATPQTVPGGTPTPKKLDLSNDYAIFDGLEPISYYPATKPEGDAKWTDGAAVVVNDARIEKISGAEVEPTAGVYLRYDTRFRLPAVNVAFTPHVGDRIRSASLEYWVVLQVGHPRFNNSWSCFCLNLSLAAVLKDSVTHKVATVTNVHGSRKTTYAAEDETASVGARIQQLTAQEIDYQGRLGFDVSHTIYTAVDLPAKFGDLLLDEATDVEYEIKSYSGRTRIDQLPAYLCKVRP